MGKAAEKLKKLREEKEKLAQLSENILSGKLIKRQEPQSSENAEVNKDKKEKKEKKKSEKKFLKKQNKQHITETKPSEKEKKDIEKNTIEQNKDIDKSLDAKLSKIQESKLKKENTSKGSFLKSLFKKKQATEQKAESKEKPETKKEKPEKKEEQPKKNSKTKEQEIPKEKKEKKEKKKRRSSYEQKKFFSAFIKKAGIESDFSTINKRIFLGAVVPVFLVSIFLIIDFTVKGTFVSDAISLLASVIVFGTAGLFLALWLLFFVYVDLKIYQRKKEIETVFPDFLQLTAANINAGMPIDRALWFAIRPRFGILAKEMETVAKSTMVGENLKTALTDFANRYDSVTIKRSVNLLLEGLDSGGEIGDLLTRVASNIRETEIIKKEMASSVTTYVIFILFATLGAAPFLFGLTTELIVIMQEILKEINIGDTGPSFGGFGGLAISGDAISISDYQIFALTSICLSSFFAAVITSVIQKGNAKEAFKRIPIYVIIGVVNYFIAFSALNLFLGGFFQ